MHSKFSRIPVLAAIAAGLLEAFYRKLATLALVIFLTHLQNSVQEKLNPSNTPEIKVRWGEWRGQKSKVTMFSQENREVEQLSEEASSPAQASCSPSSA